MPLFSGGLLAQIPMVKRLPIGHRWTDIGRKNNFSHECHMKGQICSIKKYNLPMPSYLLSRLDASEVSKTFRYRCILLRQHELSVWKKIAWQENKDLQHSHGSCKQQLLPIVSWIFQSPDYLVNTSCPQHHLQTRTWVIQESCPSLPYQPIHHIQFGLSPIDVHKNTRKIKASIWRDLPPPRIPVARLNW